MLLRVHFCLCCEVEKWSWARFRSVHHENFPEGIEFGSCVEQGSISAGFDGYKAQLKDGTEAKPPAQSIPKSPGFYKEWINACKGGPRSTCDFVNYSGALAEAVLLANAAFRAGEGFDWDAPSFKEHGNSKVSEYLRPEFAKGWEVDEI